MRLVGIHQPNFLPWLGYFDKIRRSDVFVLLDNAQLSKTGGTWANRVKLLVGGAEAWVTVPVTRNYHGTRTIAETQIDEHAPWRRKLLKTIELNYRRAPHFEAVYPWLTGVIEFDAGNLGDYNVFGIRSVMQQLEVPDAKLMLASALGVDGSSTELLASLVRRAHGDAYLAGGGAAGYQDDSVFENAGIEVVRQDFQHPTYPQFNSATFVPGLSIVDALMNIGFEGTASIL